MSPDDCGRYVLIQRGDRICGTWSYVATADVYAGEVQATAVSATRARRTRICGRPGSATKTDCATGWQTIERPLRICDGKLSESPDSAARCMGRYVRSADPGTLVEALAAQPWVKACLTPGAQVAP
jgi:hypothetical protein